VKRLARLAALFVRRPRVQEIHVHVQTPPRLDRAYIERLDREVCMRNRDTILRGR
jgi:hypothetical protein